MSDRGRAPSTALVARERSSWARGVGRTSRFLVASDSARCGSAPACSQNSAAWSAKASGCRGHPATFRSERRRPAARPARALCTARAGPGRQEAGEPLSAAPIAASCRDASGGTSPTMGEPARARPAVSHPSFRVTAGLAICAATGSQPWTFATGSAVQSFPRGGQRRGLRWLRRRRPVRIRLAGGIGDLGQLLPVRGTRRVIRLAAGQRAHARLPGERTREVTLDPGDLCGHSDRIPRARRKPARTGRGRSPVRCGPCAERATAAGVGWSLGSDDVEVGVEVIH